MAKRELKWNIEQGKKEGNGARSVPQNVPEARCQKVKQALVVDQGIRVMRVMGWVLGQVINQQDDFSQPQKVSNITPNTPNTRPQH